MTSGIHLHRNVIYNKPETNDNGPLTTDINRRYKKSGHCWPLLLTGFRWRSFDDYNALFFIKLLKHHLDYLAFFRRHQLANVVCLNRQFAMLFAAIDEHGKLHASGPAKVY